MYRTGNDLYTPAHRKGLERWVSNQLHINQITLNQQMKPELYSGLNQVFPSLCFSAIILLINFSRNKLFFCKLMTRKGKSTPQKETKWCADILEDIWVGEAPLHVPVRRCSPSIMICFSPRRRSRHRSPPLPS